LPEWFKKCLKYLKCLEYLEYLKFIEYLKDPTRSDYEFEIVPYKRQLAMGLGLPLPYNNKRNKSILDINERTIYDMVDKNGNLLYRVLRKTGFVVIKHNIILS